MILLKIETVLIIVLHRYSRPYCLAKVALAHLSKNHEVTKRGSKDGWHF
jgi:hypothetical protein